MGKPIIFAASADMPRMFIPTPAIFSHSRAIFSQCIVGLDFLSAAQGCDLLAIGAQCHSETGEEACFAEKKSCRAAVL